MGGICKECNRLVEPASKPRWEHYQDKLELIEYIKLHILSLEQDLEEDARYQPSQDAVEKVKDSNPYEITEVSTGSLPTWVHKFTAEPTPN